MAAETTATAGHDESADPAASCLGSVLPEEYDLVTKADREFLADCAAIGMHPSCGMQEV
jgi:hypothetical protein